MSACIVPRFEFYFSSTNCYILLLNTLNCSGKLLALVTWPGAPTLFSALFNHLKYIIRNTKKLTHFGNLTNFSISAFILRNCTTLIQIVTKSSSTSVLPEPFRNIFSSKYKFLLETHKGRLIRLSLREYSRCLRNAISRIGLITSAGQCCDTHYEWMRSEFDWGSVILKSNLYKFSQFKISNIKAPGEGIWTKTSTK